MLILILIATIPLVTGQATVKVLTTEGIVVGATANDGNYTVFLGIPYAGTVSASNRFKAPPPPSKHQEEFNAVNRTILCISPGTQALGGVEDCLTLDVFTNNVNSSSPVFVWLNHEERYTDSPQPSFKSLVEANVVVIAVNFRLSVFGFLCLGVTEAPGNAGLKDIIQALKWIKQNAANFGGDPNNVVLIGHRSGAAMVDLITLSPLSESLVNKAIALSGSGLAPWAVALDPIEYASALGVKVNFTGKTTQELALHFAKTDKEKLANAVSELQFSNDEITFAPCVENEQLPGSLLENAPIKNLKSGKYHPIPYIAAYEEGMNTVRDRSEMIERIVLDLLPQDLELNESIRTNIVRDIISKYFSDKVDINTIKAFMNYKDDTYTILPVIRSVMERAANSNSVYLLSFSFVEEFNDIVDYILNRRPADNEPRYSLINRFVAFAKTLVPVSHGSLHGYSSWYPFSTKEKRFLNIKGNVRTPSEAPNFEEQMLRNPRNDTPDFWESRVSYRTPKPANPISPEIAPKSYTAIIWTVVALLLAVIIVLLMYVYRRILVRLMRL